VDDAQPAAALSAVEPKPPIDALMYRMVPTDPSCVCILRVEASSIAFWQKLGWTKLISERDVRHNDIEDVRRDDETRWKR
jgi:hypothetical protein